MSLIAYKEDTTNQTLNLVLMIKQSIKDCRSVVHKNRSFMHLRYKT